MKIKSIIFIAPPASGKGTVSKELVDKYEYHYLSTGEILREISKTDMEIKNKMKNGEFISDDVIFGLIDKEISKLKDKPFILDGVPRNLKQAEYLDSLFKKDGVDNYVVINLEIEKDILEKRLSGRRLCECGKSYNIYFSEFKPIKDDVCDKCGKKLIKRLDDDADIFKKRYDDYLDKTMPVLKYYDNQNKLSKVYVNRSNEEILDDIKKIIEG